MVKAKICGNRSGNDIRIAAKAEAAGFIVGTPESARNLEPEAAAGLIKDVPPFISTVLVTTEKDPQRLRGLTAEARPDYLQLHSELSPEKIREIADSIPQSTEIISLLSVKADRENLAKAFDLSGSPIKALLLDSKVAGRSGGTGQVHDWNISRAIRDALYPFPVILAGGLDPDNVGEAIRKVRPYAVDVATGVEEDGSKSERKVESFLKEVRNSGD